MAKSMMAINEDSKKVRIPRKPKVKESDLLVIFDDLNRAYFGGMVYGGIGWRFFRIGKKDFTLATCEMTERFIRVSNVLEDRRIPVWFLKFVVYHEMIHLYLGPQQFDRAGYSYPHNSRFKLIEQRHSDYEKAVNFELTKLPRIIESWRAWRSYVKQRDQEKNKSKVR